jgi:hypothetical protein
MSDARRAFVDRQNRALGRFLDRGNEYPAKAVGGFFRSYACECGFSCRAPGDIYDHAQTCGPPQRQLDLCAAVQAAEGCIKNDRRTDSGDAMRLAEAAEPPAKGKAKGKGKAAMPAP